ncbi:MAG: GNAT family N-acetyltransferase [Candidatus Promineifilaceae bacterium]
MFDEIRASCFPVQLIDQISIRSVSPKVAFTAAGKLYKEVFTPLGDLGLFQMPDARKPQQRPLKVALNRHTEYFLFYDGEEPFGWSIGEQHDAETYFMTWSGIHPDYQRRGVYSAFMLDLLSYLKKLGYERVTSNHSVNNNAVIIAKLKAGFQIKGVTLDERFGPVVDLVYYLHDDRKAGFESAFSLPEY